jgi:hypothetical protein
MASTVLTCSGSTASSTGAERTWNWRNASDTGLPFAIVLPSSVVWQSAVPVPSASDRRGDASCPVLLVGPG